MAWNMIPPSDGELEELIEKDAMNDQDVGDLVDYLLKDGDDDKVCAEVNGRKRAGAKGATLPKTRNGSSPDKPATNGVKAGNGKRRASSEATENGNGTGKAPAGLTLRTSRSLSLEIRKRNSGTRFNVVDDGDDMDVETPTKKTRVNNLNMRDSDSDRSRSNSQISFDGPLSPQNRGLTVWDTVNNKVKAEHSNGHGGAMANAEGKGAANGSKSSFKHALNTSQPVRARAVSADRDKASTCNNADLRRYSNGSEESKYLIKSMAEPLRRAYFRLIDHKVITEYDVDNMCLQKLCTLGCKESLDILSIFAEEAKYTSFRNPSAYLAQVIANQTSRIKQVKVGEAGKAAGDSASEASEDPQAQVELLPKIQERLNGLFKSGQIDKKMMDVVLYQHLASLPETAAMALLVTLEGIDMSKVRNFTAFFISLKNKYRKEALSRSKTPARLGSWQAKVGWPAYNNSLGGGHPHGATAGQWRRPHGYGSSRDANWRDKSAQAQSALKDHTKFQVALGVRTSELHKLSPFAQYTPGIVTLHLQNMHDKGIEFVTLLDDRSWKALTMLEESLAISVITDVGERLKQDMINEKMGVSQDSKRIRNVNAFFLDVVKKQSELLQGLGANSKLGEHISSPFSSPNSGGGTPGGFNQVRRNLDPKRFEILSKETKKELDLLVTCSRGLLTLDMFDSRAVNLLVRLGDENMKLVSDQLRKMDTRRIRNLFAFFLGMCRNYVNSSMVRT